MKIILVLFFAAAFSSHIAAQSSGNKGEYYRIIVYHFASDSQQLVLDNYFRESFLPALHKKGFQRVGVFKPVTNDTATDKRIVIWLQSAKMDKLIEIDQAAEAGADKNGPAQVFEDASYDHPPYTRKESILLHSFRLAPFMQLPQLKSAKQDHIYELRSYESPTEKLYRNKVTMFNEGGEIALFKQLNFNAVFYADVLSGSRMPNLMYMTSFENMADRDAHWKTFINGPEWKRLSTLPIYQHNVSHADIILMRAADYSDF